MTKRTDSAGLVASVDLFVRNTVVDDVVERVVVAVETSLQEAQFLVDLVVVVIRFRELRVDAVVTARAVQRRRLVFRRTHRHALATHRCDALSSAALDCVDCGAVWLNDVCTALAAAVACSGSRQRRHRRARIKTPRRQLHGATAPDVSRSDDITRACSCCSRRSHHQH